MPARRTFRKLLTPFLDPLKGGAARVKLAIAIVLLILARCRWLISSWSC
jgi:hypothetical protein